jgi:hypothetical protein
VAPGARSIEGDPAAAFLIEELLTGISDAMKEILEDNPGVIRPEQRDSVVLSTLATALYRVGISVVIHATPDQREHNRAGVLESLHKMCHGIALAGQTDLPAPKNLRLN